MTPVTEYLPLFFAWLVRSTAQASVLAILIIVTQGMLGRRLSARWRSALWVLLVVRLLLPWSPESSLSVFNLSKGLDWKGWIAAERTPLTGLTGKKDSEGVNGTPLTGLTIKENSAATPSEMTRIGASPISQESSAPETNTAILYIILSGIWALGAIALFGRVVLESVRLGGAAGRRTLVTNQAVLDTLEACKAEMGMRGVYLAVEETSAVSSPALFGVMRPRLLLPEGATQRLSREELRFIFLHELGHLKRHDIAVNWIAVALQAVHWFNPLLWFAFHRMRGDREMACDALVLSRAGAEKDAAYGRTILSLLQKFAPVRRLSPVAGILEDQSLLKRRIKMIAQFRKHSLGWSVVSAMVLVMLGCATLTWPQEKSKDKQNIATVHSQENDKTIPTITIEPGKSVDETITFTSGIQALLIGVANPPDPRECWSPDGSRMLPVPKGYLDDTGRLSFANKNISYREFFVRVQSMRDPYDVGVHYKLIPSYGESGGYHTKDGAIELGFVGGVVSGQTSATLRLGVAVGDWKTLTSTDGKGSQTTKIIKKKPYTIIFSDAISRDNSLSITVSHNLVDKNLRLIAIDEKNVIHKANKSGGSSAENRQGFDQITYEFMQIPQNARIVRFEFQVRDYEWREIQNIQLQPAKGLDESVSDSSQEQSGLVQRKSNASVRITDIGSYLADNGGLMIMARVENKTKESQEIKVRFSEDDPDNKAISEGGLMIQPGQTGTEANGWAFAKPGEHNIYAAAGNDKIGWTCASKVLHINAKERMSLTKKGNQGQPGPLDKIYGPNTIIGDSIHFDVENKRLTLKGNVKLTFNEMKIKGDDVIIDTNDGHLTATGHSAIIIRKEIGGDGAKLEYWPKDEKCILTGNAKAWQKVGESEQAVSGNMITISKSADGRRSVEAAGTDKLKFSNDQTTSSRKTDKIDYPFVDDPDVIGAWESVDFVAEPDQFKPGEKQFKGDLFLKKINVYFGGSTSLAFKWTKGMFLHSGDKTASKYEIKDMDGARYMFMEWKSGDYTLRGKKPQYYVFKQVSRTPEPRPNRKVDKVDYPFVNDPDLIGTWETVDFVRDKDYFNPGTKQWVGDLLLKNLTVAPGGSTSFTWKWTKGLMLDLNASTASKYEIKNIGGSLYLFIEWKSGDYIFRGMKPQYYVLKKMLGGGQSNLPHSFKNQFSRIIANDETINLPPEYVTDTWGRIAKNFSYPSTSVVLGGLMILLGGVFIRRWLGHQYTYITPVVRIMLVGTVFSSAQMPTIGFLYGTSRNKFYAISNSIHGLLTVLLIPILLYQYGLLGAALGITIPTIFVKFFLQPVYACRALEIRPTEFFIRHAAPNFIVPLVFLAAVAMIAQPFIEPSYGSIFVIAAISCMAFVPYVYLTGFDASQRGILLRAVLPSRPVAA